MGDLVEPVGAANLDKDKVGVLVPASPKEQAEGMGAIKVLDA